MAASILLIPYRTVDYHPLYAHIRNVSSSGSDAVVVVQHAAPALALLDITGATSGVAVYVFWNSCAIKASASGLQDSADSVW